MAGRKSVDWKAWDYIDLVVLEITVTTLTVYASRFLLIRLFDFFYNFWLTKAWIPVESESKKATANERDWSFFCGKRHVITFMFIGTWPLVREAYSGSGPLLEEGLIRFFVEIGIALIIGQTIGALLVCGCFWPLLSRYAPNHIWSIRRPLSSEGQQDLESQSALLPENHDSPEIHDALPPKNQAAPEVSRDPSDVDIHLPLLSKNQATSEIRYYGNNEGS